jgi:putative CocE/NonD family hydrolase
MRKWLLLACTVLLIFPVACKAVNQDSLWMYAHYTKKEVYIPMRDGVKLFTSIYLPKNQSEQHPILMTRTPYSCAPYGKNAFRPLYKNHYNAYLKEGYIMVIQDVRGTWMSEGKFVNVRPFNPAKKGKKDIDEASDTYDTIDWLVKNIGGNNGNVGVFGISYPGFYSTMAALSGHPALKAVSPQAPVTDWFMGDDFFTTALSLSATPFPSIRFLIIRIRSQPRKDHKASAITRTTTTNITWKPALCPISPGSSATAWLSGTKCMPILLTTTGGKPAMCGTSSST